MLRDIGLNIIAANLESLRRKHDETKQSSHDQASHVTSYLLGVQMSQCLLIANQISASSPVTMIVTAAPKLLCLTASLASRQARK